MNRVLVDTSTWISHFQAADKVLGGLLAEGKVLTHPFVMGELALGQGFQQRRAMMQDLATQTSAPKADDDEVLAMVERHSLAGSGIGWVDAHLIASARLAKADLLTKDKALGRVWAKVSKS